MNYLKQINLDEILVGINVFSWEDIDQFTFGHVKNLVKVIDKKRYLALM